MNTDRQREQERRESGAAFSLPPSGWPASIASFPEDRDREGDREEEEEGVKVSEIGDGNMNFVFLVQDDVHSVSWIVKQAPPFVRCVGESWPCSPERAFGPPFLFSLSL